MKRPILLLALLAAGAASASVATLRDPFARPAAARALVAATEAPAPEPQLQLRAVMFEPGRSLVNINGQILGVGDWLGDYRLTRIAERSVTLSKGGVQRVLALDQESIKK